MSLGMLHHGGGRLRLTGQGAAWRTVRVEISGGVVWPCQDVLPVLVAADRVCWGGLGLSSAARYAPRLARSILFLCVQADTLPDISPTAWRISCCSTHADPSSVKESRLMFQTRSTRPKRAGNE